MSIRERIAIAKGQRYIHTESKILDCAIIIIDNRFFDRRTKFKFLNFPCRLMDRKPATTNQIAKKH